MNFAKGRGEERGVKRERTTWQLEVGPVFYTWRLDLRRLHGSSCLTRVYPHYIDSLFHEFCSSIVLSFILVFLVFEQNGILNLDHSYIFPKPKIVRLIQYLHRGIYIYIKVK